MPSIREQVMNLRERGHGQDHVTLLPDGHIMLHFVASLLEQFEIKLCRSVLNTSELNVSVTLCVCLCAQCCRIGPMFAMLLIGLGTGGIKPCVSAFGGDQFTSQQVTWSQTL